MRRGDARRNPPVNEPVFHLGYRPELDGLRAIAIALVFLAHISFPWPSLGRDFLPGAFQGVDLFFVLSGFLLTSLALEERSVVGRFSFRGFYRRRALRLLPALFFFLACLIPWTIQQHENVQKVLQASVWVVLYVTNWAMIIGGPGTVPFGLGHMWSLAIEEQYYLVFFPVFFVLLRWVKSLRKLTWILGFMIATVWVVRILSALHTSPGNFEATLYLRTDMRADALLWGPLVAVLLHRGFVIGPKIRLLGVPAIAYLAWTVANVHIEDRWLYIWALGMINISWTLVLVSLLGARHVPARLLRFRPIVWTGKISYGLYLWHLAIFVEMLRHTRYRPQLPDWFPFVLAVVLTFVAATFSYYVIERPFLRRKRPRGMIEVPDNLAQSPPPSNPEFVADSP